MGDDETKLPATSRNANAVAADQKQRSDVARRIRNPFSGWFFGLGSKAHSRAVDFDSAEKRAGKGNIIAQKEVIEAMMDLQDTVRVYDARQQNAAGLQVAEDQRVRGSIDENLNAFEEAAREREHLRAMNEQRRQRELRDAERDVFNANQGLKNQERLAEVNAEIWGKRAEAEKLDAMSVADRLRTQNTGSSAVPASASEVLGAAYQLALAEGKHDEALRLLAAIEARDGK